MEYWILRDNYAQGKKIRIRQDSNRITILREMGAVQTRLTCSSTKQVTDEHLLFRFGAHFLILSCKITAILQISDGSLSLFRLLKLLFLPSIQL